MQKMSLQAAYETDMFITSAYSAFLCENLGPFSAVSF